MNKNYTKLIKQIGNTPLIEIKKLHRNRNVKIFAKKEYCNLSGSIKDRAALSMVEEGESSGKLTKDKTILESTSGNTGIALAAIAKIKGYNVKLVLPDSASLERKKILRELGAELTLTNALEGSEGAHKEAGKINAQSPDKYFWTDQYSNNANPKAHYNNTAPEIWKQTNKKITHFIAAIGTSGTLIGTGKRLKESNKNIKVIAVEPEEELHGIEGLKNLRIEKTPAVYNQDIPDGTIYISTEEAYHTAVRLAKEERLFVGQSSGLNVAAALRIANRLEKGVIVTVLPDSGYKYLSKNLFPNDIFDIQIKNEDLEKIHAHAKLAYPFEACGLLIGETRNNKKLVKKVIPTENKNKAREDRYEIDPKEYIKIDNKLNKSEYIIGIYHSHPDHPPRPSETDLAIAQPAYSYIIVSTISRAIISTTAWKLDNEEKSFKEEFLLIK